MTATPFYIAGTGAALPGQPVDNAALGKAFGISEEWIDLFVGTRTRHFAWDLATGEPTHTLSDLAAEAAAHALAAAGLDAQDLDFAILTTATPDQLLPSTVNDVADRLGIDHLATYQLQAGCVGAVQALDVSRSLLAAGHRAGLVLAGDVTARFMDARRNAVSLPTEELVNYVLFGDGAGAAVVTDEALDDAVRVCGLIHRFVGLGRAPGQIVDWNGPVRRAPHRQMLREDYKAIEDHVPAMAAEILWELLDTTGWSREDVQFLLPPQLSGRMTARITAHLGVPEMREVSCVADTGNTGNALPLLQLDRLVPHLAHGERAVTITVESSKWIKGGLALEKAVPSGLAAAGDAEGEPSP
ncbi:3-oxoacyl-ACP synthase III family protein [Streptomyces beihaiensis]|uniref:3-oxoacyl-ACP synthase III family protein n=1 Tax=Streptomyces beihaiensis TaxID=2984495 RepID=A0ABT3TWF4_9ACTN|nr:3-oxoacyl-ACP synthase III family protein [Streptomyces beihaiensis]MCX3061383.1 3-oxoacyl-ACP synthase III family protein [Streptomyces beihaiensis]